MTAEPAVDIVTDCFAKVRIEAGFLLVTSTKMIPFTMSVVC